jgi:hypothetical protein
MEEYEMRSVNWPMDETGVELLERFWRSERHWLELPEGFFLLVEVERKCSWDWMKSSAVFCAVL